MEEKSRGRSPRLEREHFVKWWTDKTKVAPAASPFWHSDFETVFRRDHPFIQAIGD